MGTHPIFESDFDCLTEKPICYCKSRLKFEKMENFGSIGRIMAGVTILSGGQIWFGSPNNQVEAQSASKMSSMHGQQVLLFSICTSSGSCNAVNQYAQLIR